MSADVDDVVVVNVVDAIVVVAVGAVEVLNGLILIWSRSRKQFDKDTRKVELDLNEEPFWVKAENRNRMETFEKEIEKGKERESEIERLTDSERNEETRRDRKTLTNRKRNGKKERDFLNSGSEI